MKVQRIILLPCSLTALLLCFSTAAHAQSYSIAWYKIAGGGGTSSNGNYTVSGTIGQADAGSMSGGNYSLTGGYWGMISVVQTPGSPLLSIVNTTTNTVTLSWVAPSTGFSLQQIGSLSLTSWNAVNTNTYPVTVVGGSNTVTVPIGGNQFFRLIHP